MPTLKLDDTTTVSRASFRKRYSVESMRKLGMPVWVVYGGDSHALTTTHVDEVAQLIATLAGSDPPAPRPASHL